jgi:hypothetical protein
MQRAHCHGEAGHASFLDRGEGYLFPFGGLSFYVDVLFPRSKVPASSLQDLDYQTIETKVKKSMGAK